MISEFINIHVRPKIGIMNIQVKPQLDFIHDLS